MTDTVLGRFLEHIEANRSKATVRTYRTALVAIQAELPSSLADTDAEALREVFARFEQTLKPKSVGGRVSALRSFGKWAVQNGVWRTNLGELVDRPSAANDMTPTHTATTEQVQTLLADGVDPRDPFFHRDLAILHLLALCGLKTSELVRVDWEHVDLEERLLLVVAHEDRDRRVLAITRAVVDNLTRLRNESALEVPWVFQNSAGKRITDRSIRRLVRLMAERASLEPIAPAALRQWRVELEVNGGGPLLGVCQVAGYAHPSGALRAAGRFAQTRRSQLVRDLIERGRDE